MRILTSAVGATVFLAVPAFAQTPPALRPIATHVSGRTKQWKA